MSDSASPEVELQRNEITGFYQIFTAISVFLAGFIYADIFWIKITAYSPRHYCKVYELELFEEEIQKKVSIPLNRYGEYESCLMFDRNYSSFNDANVLTIYNESLNSQKSTPIRICHDWNYEYGFYSETLVTLYKWVCDKTLINDIIWPVSFSAIILAAIIGGLAMDWWGRRKVWILGILLRCIGYLISTFCVNEYAFLVGRFFTCFSSTLVYIAGFIIVMETCNKQSRNLFSILISCGFTFGLILFPWFAYFVPRWQHSYFLMLGISLVMIVTLPFVYESPRWLNLYDANPEYSVVSNRNRVDLSEENESDVIPVMQGELSDTQPESNDVKGYVSIKKMFETKTMVLHFCIQMFSWFIMGVVYYALFLEILNLYDDSLKIIFYIGLSEIPTFLFRKFMLDSPKLGRKYSILICLCGSGIVSILITILLMIDTNKYVLTAFICLSRSFTSAALMSYFTFTVEIYPTHIRGIALSFCFFSSACAGFLAPYITKILQEIWEPLPYPIFGFCCIGSGILTILLPETFNTDLKQSNTSDNLVAPDNEVTNQQDEIRVKTDEKEIESLV